MKTSPSAPSLERGVESQIDRIARVFRTKYANKSPFPFILTNVTSLSFSASTGTGGHKLSKFFHLLHIWRCLGEVQLAFPVIKCSWRH